MMWWDGQDWLPAWTWPPLIYCPTVIAKRTVGSLASIPGFDCCRLHLHYAFTPVLSATIPHIKELIAGREGLEPSSIRVY